MQHVHAGNQLIAVIAPTGGGKTVMAEHLQTFVEPDWLLGRVQAHEKMHTDTLSLAILDSIHPDQKIVPGEAVNQLYTYLQENQPQDRNPVFIIDDAELLPVECLEFLLQLAGMRIEEHRFSIIMFATEVINDKLVYARSGNPGAGGMFQVNLPPFTLEQTRGYISDRFALSGDKFEAPFSDLDYTRIHAESAGFPGGINLLCRHFMQERVPVQNAERHMPVGLVLAMVVAGVAGMIGYFLYAPDRGPADSALAQDIPVTQSTAAVQVGIVDHNSTDTHLVSTAIPADLDMDHALSLPAVDKLAESRHQDRSMPPDVADTLTVVEISTVPHTASARTGTGVQELISAEAPSDGGSIKESDRKIETDDELQPLPVVRHEPGNIYNLDFVPAFIRTIHGPDWLKGQPPGSAVLQILSASDVGNVLRMVEKLAGWEHQLAGYTNYTPSGRPRYMLYFGVYEDRTAAQAAIGGLPQSLNGIQPWPRGIKSIVEQLESLEVRGYY